MNEHISADRLIGYHRSRQDYIQNPITSIQFSYGDHRYTRMTYELLKQSDQLQEKILLQAIEDFSLSENVDLALLSSDLLSVVLQHLQNKNDRIRFLAARLFKKVCAVPLGRRRIIQIKCIDQFQNLIHDTLANIKAEAYDGLIDFAEFVQGIDCILEKDQILKHLVDKLIEQKVTDILLRTVILLKILMQGQQGTPKALKTQIINRLISLITHQNESIQYNVCMTLANISFNQEGKQSIVSKGHIKNIVHCLTHKDKLVREAGTLLLCSLAQLNQGKIQVLNYCDFASIVKLLDDEPPTVLNAVQLIANLAEQPRGRTLATQIQNKLEGLKSIERKYIDETLQVIRWRP